jgi:hypothetical protein
MTRAVPFLFLLVLAQAPFAAEPQRGRAGGPSREQGTPFTLGVLRRDGVVLPFASFNGRRWEMSWPADLTYLELPISLENIERAWWGRAVPPPATMTLWNDGKPRGDLTLLSPTFVELHCRSRRLGLRTNYHAAELPPPRTELPYPKDGLVVTGAQRVDAIETLAKGSPEMRDTAQAILEEFNEEETYAAGAFTSWRHPVPKAQRARLPIEIETLYRAPMDEPGWSAYYFEAVRRYAARPQDDGCGLLTTARGWLRTGPKGEKRVELGAQITYCDRFAQTFMLPLGLIRAGGSTYWVYQLAGYLNEAYAVVRPTPRQIERPVGFVAGFCPW